MHSLTFGLIISLLILIVIGFVLVAPTGTIVRAMNAFGDSIQCVFRSIYNFFSGIVSFFRSK